MESLLVVLIIIVSILLIGVVLIQNPKGGGMSSNITGGNQVFGVKRTTDILEKSTWYLVIGLVVLSIFLNVNMSGTTEVIEQGSKLKDVATPAMATPELPATQDMENLPPVEEVPAE